MLVDRRRRDAARGSPSQVQRGAGDDTPAPPAVRPHRRALLYSVVALAFFGAVAVATVLVTRVPGGAVVRAADGQAVRLPDLASLPPLRARIVSIAGEPDRLQDRSGDDLLQQVQRLLVVWGRRLWQCQPRRGMVRRLCGLGVEGGGGARHVPVRQR